MLQAGLTGGIASGKSLVARVLRDLGAHVIDADRIVHELLRPEQPASQEVLDRFGKELLTPEGCIDRRKLGELVFGDPEKRAWLNECLHPRVFDAYQAQVRNLRSRPPDSIIVLDAALLVETGFYRRLEKLIVVYADQEQQVERLAVRDNLTAEQALARIGSQLPLAVKRAYADYVIDNTGSREHTEHQAKDVFEKLKQEAKRTP